MDTQLHAQIFQFQGENTQKRVLLQAHKAAHPPPQPVFRQLFTEIEGSCFYHIRKREIFLSKQITRFDPSEEIQHGGGREIFPKIDRNHEDDGLSALPPAAFLMNRTQKDRCQENGHGNAVLFCFL